MRVSPFRRKKYGMWIKSGQMSNYVTFFLFSERYSTSSFSCQFGEVQDGGQDGGKDLQGSRSLAATHTIIILIIYIPHLVEHITGFLLKEKSFRDIATRSKGGGGPSAAKQLF